MESEIATLFPSPFYIGKNVDVSGLTEKIEDLEHVRVHANNGHSTVSKTLLHDDGFEEIRAVIEAHLQSFKKSLGVADTVDLVITNSWATMHDKGDYAHRHHHDNALLSGILYIDVDDDSGSIRFYNQVQNLFPTAIALPIAEYNIFNSANFTFLPKKGDLFIFPSQIPHEVAENNSDIKRRLIAFNVFVKGKIGKYDEMSELEIH